MRRRCAVRCASIRAHWSRSSRSSRTRWSIRMRVPAEIALSAALVIAATAGYLVVATEGPPAAGGFVGHGLGALGFLLMLVGTAGYAWRKRRSGPGAMQRWLQAHVVTGLVGPYLVLLHTGFAFRGIAGASFVLVAVVVVSGIIGRFVY